MIIKSDKRSIILWRSIFNGFKYYVGNSTKGNHVSYIIVSSIDLFKHIKRKIKWI